MGVCQRQISYYAQDGMPQVGKGVFCVEDCQAWVAANVGLTKQVSASERGFWEEQKAKWDARQKKLQYRQLAGELIEVDIIAREQERSIAHAKALAEQIPDRLIGLLPRVVTAKPRQRLLQSAKQMIEDFLFALSDSMAEAEQDGDSDDSTDESGAAAAADRQRVAADQPRAGSRLVRKKSKAAERDKQQPRPL